ncbi:DUF6916 family protein [Antarctobacter heliothermus]|uniref:DUF6916 domain-containing protein n=1 Tax=Antarctobacter heliothermus TaxID=74033 RepID=A0A239HVH1_9RHOB|nr:hypothetical protein [Antarctobacter heliothermus]SNS85430.1 hypothetical protein SAMN04488078_103716 [Antarctobacter heliothermus]
MDVATLTAEQVEPLIGQPVSVATSQGALALTVDSVAPHSGDSRPDAAVRGGFTVTLSGPQSPMLEQGAWEITLPGLGAAALFLSPFDQTDTATRYEIIFN